MTDTIKKLTWNVEQSSEEEQHFPGFLRSHSSQESNEERKKPFKFVYNKSNKNFVRLNKTAPKQVHSRGVSPQKPDDREFDHKTKKIRFFKNDDSKQQYKPQTLDPSVVQEFEVDSKFFEEKKGNQQDGSKYFKGRKKGFDHTVDKQKQYLETMGSKKSKLDMTQLAKEITLPALNRSKSRPRVNTEPALPKQEVSRVLKRLNDNELKMIQTLKERAEKVANQHIKQRNIISNVIKENALEILDPMTINEKLLEKTKRQFVDFNRKVRNVFVDRAFRTREFSTDCAYSTISRTIQSGLGRVNVKEVMGLNVKKDKQAPFKSFKSQENKKFFWKKGEKHEQMKKNLDMDALFHMEPEQDAKLTESAEIRKPKELVKRIKRRKSEDHLTIQFDQNRCEVGEMPIRADLETFFKDMRKHGRPVRVIDEGALKAVMTCLGASENKNLLLMSRRVFKEVME